MSDAPLIPRDYIEQAAIVRGFSAFMLQTFLERHWDEWLAWTAKAAASQSHRAELTSTQLALEQAAAVHRRQVDESASISASFPPAEMEADWISVKQASDLLGKTDRRIRQLAADGELVAVRDSTRWRIRRSSVKP